MRKLVIIFISLFLIITIIFIIVMIKNKINTNRNISNNNELYLVSIDKSKCFKSKNGKKVIIIFFNPGCEHCENEADELANVSNNLSSVEIIMISLSPKDSIIAFSRRHHLNNHNNIYFVCDSLAKMHIKYKVRSIPTTFIYGSNGILTKQIYGEINEMALLKWIN